MSKTPMEKPLERLNYYNGMAVDAAGFKTEQDYHIRVRRWLNKSLYSAGIASGLEVRALPPDPVNDLPPRVAVSPGLALDSEGREIILLEETPVEVCSYSGTNASTVVGNYLVIEYGEEAIAYESGSCAVRTLGTGGGKSTSHWGGPSRVQAKPKFSWVPFVPLPGANQIVLARVELTAKTCDAVHQIDTGSRRYVGAASAAKVRQYALEGEREVAFIPKEAFHPLPAPSTQPADVNVTGRIYFHVRGRQPSAVTLYLRAEDFSLLHYTEMGLHNHGLSVAQNVSTSAPVYYPDLSIPDKYKHDHGLGSVETNTTSPDDGSHENHGLIVAFAGIHSAGAGGKKGSFRVETDLMLVPYGSGALTTVPPAPVVPVPLVRGDLVYADILGVFNDPDLAPANGGPFSAKISGGDHKHIFAPAATTGESRELFDDHTHSFSPTVTLAIAGVDYPARDGKALSFVDSLQISLGTVGKLALPVTEDIKRQLADTNRADWADSAGNPKALGDGSGNHVLATGGTGAIRLDFLPGVSFSEGEYCIELSCKVRANNEPNGGRIHYNLYIE